MKNNNFIGLNRNIIDKFYTKDTIVKLCINFIKDNIIINNDDLIIEPSAGNGAFINEIKLLSNNYLFYDIEPENNEIIKKDYLEFNSNEIINKYKNIHIIGNPPFGRQSSIAIKFIKKSCEFSNTISFILPKSFRKDSLKKYFPINFHLINELILPDKSFLINDIEYNVPCIFQIWEKKIINRIINEKLIPNNFTFVKKNENPDISFRRVGVNAGNIDINIETKNIQSHYFIKFTNNKPLEYNIKLLSNIIFDFDNVVGPKSISKQEIIYKFNNLLKEE
jgi:predicted RNA methylase